MINKTLPNLPRYLKWKIFTKAWSHHFRRSILFHKYKSGIHIIFITTCQNQNTKLILHKNRILIPKVPFCVSDKLKNKIQKFIIRFCFYLNITHEIQIIDYYFRVKIDFCFEFLMLSFIFHFHKKWKTKYNLVFAFYFHVGIEKRIT